MYEDVIVVVNDATWDSEADAVARKSEMEREGDGLLDEDSLMEALFVIDTKSWEGETEALRASEREAVVDGLPLDDVFEMVALRDSEKLDDSEAVSV